MAHELAAIPKSESLLRQGYKKYLNLKGRVNRISEKSEEAVEKVIRTVEVVSSAALFGAIQGAWYDPKDSKDKPGVHIGPVPVEVAAGAVLLAGSLMGLGGKYSDHLTNFADGAFAAYVSNVARGWGYKFKKDRDAKSGTSGASLRDELDALVNA